MKKFGRAKFINKFTVATNNNDTNTDFLNTIMNAINEGNKNTQNNTSSTVNAQQVNNQVENTYLQPEQKQEPIKTMTYNKPNNIFFNLPLYPTHNLNDKKDD